MGYIRHNAIIVTSWERSLIGLAAEKARDIGLAVIGPSEPGINGYSSLCVVPDGSKEGWSESDDGDIRRRQFRQWLHEQRYDDDSSSLEWFEASYGSDDRDAKIEHSTWEERDALPLPPQIPLLEA